jgi:hypothetical protein
LLRSNRCASWRWRNRTFFIGLAMTDLRPSKAEAEHRIDGDGADPEQGGDRQEAIRDSALCSAILGSMISRRWGSEARRACQRLAHQAAVAATSAERIAASRRSTCSPRIW